MSLLRLRYLQGLFRRKPPPECIDLPGEAEMWDSGWSGFNQDAWKAAMCLDLEWTEDARDWVENVVEEGLAVAVEQCCHDGHVLPCELRVLRLQRFEPSTASDAVQALARLPGDGAEAALTFLCWYVRIERAKRTGHPDLDPARQPAVAD
jgi:hypothetical protein